VDRDREPIPRRRQEGLGHHPALGGIQKDPLAGGAEHQQPIQPGPDVKVDQRGHRGVVDRVAADSQRGDRRGQRPVERAARRQNLSVR
jgi:hypothetical protein